MTMGWLFSLLCSILVRYFVKQKKDDASKKLDIYFSSVGIGFV